MLKPDKHDMTEMVLSIFADCTNVGLPFQDTLLAIYLSGLQYGQKVAEEMADDQR